MKSIFFLLHMYLHFWIIYISQYECSRLTRDVKYDNTIVTGNEPYSVRSLVECATMCTHTCIALSYSRDLTQCHMYMEHPDEEQLETKASMSLYLVAGVDNFIPPTPTTVFPLLDQFSDVTFSPSHSFTVMITNDLQSQPGAVLQCAIHGATLVRINTPEKQAYLKNVLTTSPEFGGSDYWIEGTNIQALNKLDPSSWIFADLSNMPMGDPYWAPGAPNSPIIENCVRMQKNKSYKWNDRSCIALHGYICEK